MADFTGVIRRAVDGLATNTPEARQKVYDRARQTIQRQLEAMPSMANSAIFEKQLASVEDAILVVENEYTEALPADGSDQLLPAEQSEPAPDIPVGQTAEQELPEAASPVVENNEPVETSTSAVEDVAPLVTSSQTDIEEPFVSERDPVASDVAHASLRPAIDVPADRPGAKMPAAPDYDGSVNVIAEAGALEDKLTDRDQSDFSQSSEYNVETGPQDIVDDFVSTGTEKVDDFINLKSSDEIDSDPDSAKIFSSDESITTTDVEPDTLETVSEDKIDTELEIPLATPLSPIEVAVSGIVKDVSAKIDAVPHVENGVESDAELTTDESIFDQAVGEIKSSLETEVAPVDHGFANHDETFGFGEEALPEAPQPKSKKPPMVIIIAAALAVVAAGAYGVWRVGFDGISDVVPTISADVENKDTDATQTEIAENSAVTQETQVAENTDATNSQSATAEPNEDVGKFTQRLNADGTENDAGPAEVVSNDLPGEEGRSVASQSEGQSTDAAQSQTTEAQVPTDGAPILQKMLFYETSLGLEQQARYEGSVVWSEEVETDGSVSRPFIRAQIQVPEREISIVLTVKLNGDQTLPVSHLVDINFALPDDFEGGEIDQVTEVKMKNTEEQTGDRLAAISAKIDQSFFVVGLENDNPEVVASNLQLLSQRSWIDIPISYSNGRKALITLEKGASGVAIFDKVLAAWERNPAQ